MHVLGGLRMPIEPPTPNWGELLNLAKTIKIRSTRAHSIFSLLSNIQFNQNTFFGLPRP